MFVFVLLSFLSAQAAWAANPTLTLRKVVQSGSMDANQWTLTAIASNGAVAISDEPQNGSPTDRSTSAVSVAPGTYRLGETGPGGVYLPGYTAQLDFPTFSYWSCDGGVQTVLNNLGDNITLAADENVTCTITNADTPDPDLPGAAANLETIPEGSLIIPMDTVLQLSDEANNDSFNLTAYGLVNKLLQNNIPVKWAVRSNKIKVVGIHNGGANSASLVDTSKNFVTLGVQVGDLVTNIDKGMNRARVTAVAATTLTLSAIDPIDFDNNDDYVIDQPDFTAMAERIRPSAVAEVSTRFAGGPFIVSNEIPFFVDKALEIILGTNDGIAPDLTTVWPLPDAVNDDDVEDAQEAVRVYRTTTDTLNVDVRYNLTHKPFAAISDWNTDIHADIMGRAAIPGATAGKKGAYVNCTKPGKAGFDPNLCNWNQINPIDLSSIECATVHLEPHRDGQATSTVEGVITAVRNFVAGGGNFVAQCHGVEYFENADERIDSDESVLGNFITTRGISKNSDGDLLKYPNSPMPFGQMTGPLQPGIGGSVPDWVIPDGGSYRNNGYIEADETAVDATVVTQAAVGKLPTGGGVGGVVMYLGGHEYASNTLDAINGQRMVLNALFIPPDRPSSCGLTINGELILVKEVINDDPGGNDAVVNDFNITTNAGTLVWDAGDTNGDTTTYTSEPLTVIAGVEYSFSEVAHDDYIEGVWACAGGDGLGGGPFDGGTVILGAGQTKTCTISNDDIASNPDISIIKEGTLDLGEDGIANPGDIITYELSVSNAGDTPLTDVAVTDPLITDPPNSGTIDCSPESNPIATLAVGVTVECTATYAITQADIDAGERDNTATATGECTNEALCPVTDNDDNTETIPQEPGISIVKEGEFDQGVDDESTVGDIITYTFDVTNTGNLTLTNVAVTDPLVGLSPIDCSPENNPIASLAPGVTVQCTATYAITQADIDAGKRDNTATATGDCSSEDDCPVTDDDPATVDIPTESDIDLIKTLENPAVLEDDGTYTVIYTIQAVNNGNATGTYDLIDTFSPGSGITLNSAAAVYVAGSENSQTGTTGAYPNFVTGETLAAGQDESWEVTANFTVNPSGVSPDDSQCDPGEPLIDTGFYNAVTGVANEEDTTNNDTCTSLPPPDINLAKTVNGPAVQEPDDSYTVVYTITAQNDGDGPGYYDLVDSFAPGPGITLNTATVSAVYVAGTEGDQSGMLGDYPNFVTGEALAAGLNESWTVTANFTIDPAELDEEDSFCDPADPVENTGFYNEVSGVDQETDLTDNDTCAPFQTITLVATPSCVNDVPWVNYQVTVFGFNPAPTSLTYTWINRDEEPDVIVSGPTVTSDFTEDLLWPGATADGPDPGANGLTWPGWTESPPGTWSFSDTNQIPNLALLVEVNPTDEAALIYPPAVPTCNPAPPAVLTVDKTVQLVTSPDTNLFNVTFRITARNTGGQSGVYDLADQLFVDESLTPVSVVTALHHVPGTEAVTDGTLVPATAAEYAAGATILTGESLGAGLNEHWEVTIQFELDPATITEESADCTADGEGDNTGFTNHVDLLVDQQVVDEADACEPIPLPEAKTQFRVVKDFTDDNPAHVEVEISCFTGLPLIQNQEIWEGRDVVFVVESFDPGELDCDISEVIPEGYSPTYTASNAENGIAGGITNDAEGCHFTEVESGEFLCEIVNTPDPVDVVIEKVWVIEGAEGDVVDTRYKLKLFCDSEIVDGSTYCGHQYSAPTADQVAEIWCKTFQGDASHIFTGEVIPDWPDTECWVEETVYDDAVEVDNGCEELVVSAGHGASCVVTNTVFFEGIPTLNQYGLAILALLMMGVGLVGFRRFV